MAYLLDTNVLIYAANRDHPQHQVCLAWLMAQLSKGTTIYATDLVKVALLRVSTLSLLETAARVSDVFNFLDDLHHLENYQHISSTSFTKDRWRALCQRYQLQGNDVNDAYCAVLALEHKATLVSADKGFSRFTELSWLNPVEHQNLG